MRSALIIVGDPLFQYPAHMPFVQRNQEIEAFSPHGAHQSFTESVRLRRPIRSTQDSYAHRLQAGIKVMRINTVAVVEDESIRLLTRDDFAKLLERPGCRRVSGDIEVFNLARSYFHEDEDIKDSEASGHDDEEIAGQYCLGVVSHKRHPTLRRNSFPRSRVYGHVASDRPSRYANPEFEK